jgi:hypothetical protein
VINKDLSKNWQKFLSFNSKVDILDNPIDTKDKIRIPLTSIETNTYLLYYLFEEIYPKFINDQLNVIDIIISDYEIDNIVLEAFFYQMNKPGVHDNVKELNKNELKIKFKDLNNKELLLHQIQSSLSKNHDIRITHFRIIKKRGLDLINRHVEGLSKLSFLSVIESFLDLLQTLINKDLIIFYPQPPILNFLKETFQIIKKLKLSKLYNYIIELFPPVDFSIILKSKVSPILIDISNSTQNNKSNDINLSIDWIRIPENEPLDLDKTRVDLNRKYIISLQLELLLNYFIEIIESSFPISQEKVKLLLQKFLFGVRSYQNYWNITPKPLIYNTFIRYLLRIFGFDLNLMKLSHWAIPNLFFSIFNSYGGMQGNILLVLTDLENKQYPRDKLLMVRIENGTLINIEKAELEEELLKSNNYFEELRMNVSKKYGVISIIIKVDKKLIRFLLEDLIVNFYQLNIFKILKLVRLLKNPNYFEISPPIPFYTLITTKNSFTLLKNILSISIDKHNF